MRKFIIMGALLGSWLLGWSPLQAAGTSVAMVTDVKGQADVVGKGYGSPVKLLDYLNAGDQVALGKDGAVTLVYLDSGVEYQFSGQSNVTLNAGSPASDQGASQPTAQLKEYNRIDLAALSGGNLTQGAITMRGIGNKNGVELTQPVDDAVMMESPRFSWKKIAGAKSYRFALLNDRSERIFEKEVTTTSMTLPNTLTLSFGANYTWEVEALGTGRSRTGSREFTMVDEELRRNVLARKPAKEAPFSRRVLYAAYLESMGLVDFARDYWVELAKERPDLRIVENR